MKETSPRVLVVGVSGFLGGYLAESLRAFRWAVTGTYHSQPRPDGVKLDIRRPAELDRLCSEYSPDVVCLCAAEPNVDYCEQHPAETAAVNVEGTRNTALAASRIGARVVFFSSDYVFDGTSGPYQEPDPVAPLSEYGRQKVRSERLLQELVPDCLILRVTVLYGWESQGKNFFEHLLRTVSRGQTLRVPNDQIGSPTLVNNLAEIAAQLVTQGARGLYHIAGPDRMDRYSFALQVANVFELDASKIVGVPTSELKQAARRPLCAGIRADRVRKEISVKLVGVSEGLQWLKTHPGVSPQPRG